MFPDGLVQSFRELLAKLRGNPGLRLRRRFGCRMNNQFRLVFHGLFRRIAHDRNNTFETGLMQCSCNRFARLAMDRASVNSRMVRKVYHNSVQLHPF